MNIDDPKLTAFALDELDEPEKSVIAREVAQSPEAQRVIDETRELARVLKNEFAAELNEKEKPPLSLSDIHDDPWFWSIARPLGIAATIAIAALIAALVIGRYTAHWNVNSTVADKGQITAVLGQSPSAEDERMTLTGSNVPAAEEVGPPPEFHEEFAI